MKKKSTLIIAEAGVNHNGQPELAYKLIDEALEAKADMVKFQTFNASKLTTQSASKADYQLRSTDQAESQQEMLKKLQLSPQEQLDLRDYADKKGVEFISSPFDTQSALWLINEMGLETLKIGSGELTNGPMLLKIAQKQPEIIISTGMANLGDIEDALAVMAFGYLNPTKEPKSFNEIMDIYNTPEAHKILKQQVTILHCTTEYPAPFDQTNLRSMKSIGEIFDIPVGFSDHTPGISIPIAAVALGATVIEKHFTTDKNLPGPDHKASLEPDELKAMVKAIREVEVALGTFRKAPSPVEMGNKKIARKSLVSETEIKMGEPFTHENLTSKRPGTGISPMAYWDYIGTTAKKNYQPDELI